MAAARVQEACVSDSANATTVAITISAVGNGNGVAGIVMWGSATNTLVSVTDNQSNTYTIHGTQLNPGGNNRSTARFYRLNITNAPTIITATVSPGVTYHSMGVVEFSGCDAFDGGVSQAQTPAPTGTDGMTSTAITTTANGDFIVGGAIDTFSWRTNPFFTAGTNFTNKVESGNGTNNFNCAVESRVQATAGSVAATFTVGTAVADSATHVMAFKAAAAAGGQAPRSMAIYSRRRG